jgi:predicted SAM-dependent methyltransferase
LIYKDNGLGPFWDWTVGDLLTEGITGVHMGLTLIRMSLLDKMDSSEPLFLTRRGAKTKAAGVSSFSGTEDLYFCDRAIKEAGAKILVDTSVLAGHINNASGQIFGLPEDSPPMRGAWWMKKPSSNGDDKEEEKPKKRALDIGAGTNKRTWEGYEAETTDIREGVGATYTMDTRWLNLPDDSYDLVASCHHLEHIPRADQEKVWSEMFRITKPGGTCEHVIPNLEWAGRKLAEGSVDANVMNVLYGAQEFHGENGNEWNTHFFGYTPDLARSLATQAGYTEIETESWLENDDLGYNLIIRGKKPEDGGSITEMERSLRGTGISESTPVDPSKEDVPC